MLSVINFCLLFLTSIWLMSFLWIGWSKLPPVDVAIWQVWKSINSLEFTPCAQKTHVPNFLVIHLIVKIFWSVDPIAVIYWSLAPNVWSDDLIYILSDLRVELRDYFISDKFLCSCLCSGIIKHLNALCSFSQREIKHSYSSECGSLKYRLSTVLVLEHNQRYRISTTIKKKKNPNATKL